MPDTYQPTLRIHRVTTQRRNLRELQCPLEPEMLVAEFAGELPPEVALAVREHIAVCEICGARSRRLRSPYELLASLGAAPVAFVPDLRDSVKRRIGAGRFYRGLLRTAATVGRGGALGVGSVIGIAALVLFLIVGVLFSARAQTLSRSTNTLTHPPAAAATGVLLAQTDKVLTVTDKAGTAWNVAEVVAVNERNGVVLRSLPASDAQPRAGVAANLPVASSVSADGLTVYEITAPNAKHQQAIIAFDVATGNPVFITVLTLPSGQALGTQAQQLTLAADGTLAYVGLATPHAGNAEPRALVLDAHTGHILRLVAPSLLMTLPLPPPPGSLPASAFPSVVPHLDITGYRVAQGAAGALAVSPDGKWLFDLLLITSPTGEQYAVVRRIDVNSGATVQELGLPGDFTLASFATNAAALHAIGASTTPTPTPSSASASPILTPQLYLVKGSPDAQLFVLDPSLTGPTLVGAVPLGGPVAPSATRFSGSLVISAASDGTHVYLTQNVSGAGGSILGHDLWFVDTSSMGLAAHRVADDAAEAVLANGAGQTCPAPAPTADGATPTAGSAANQPICPRTFVLRGGQVAVMSPDLTGAPVLWFNLGDGHAVTHLLASAG